MESRVADELEVRRQRQVLSEQNQHVGAQVDKEPNEPTALGQVNRMG